MRYAVVDFLFTAQFWGGLGAAIYCGARRTSFWKMADTASMGLVIAQIIGGWGDFFNREFLASTQTACLQWSSRWIPVRTSEVTKLHEGTSGDFQRYGTYIQVHPVFFYESLWCLLLLLLMLLCTWRKKFQGEMFLRYLAGYGLGKCVIELASHRQAV